ncbi:MAG: VOC family protein [Lautropia sp.]|nr:VOC family protein [Lautropia sp.]
MTVKRIVANIPAERLDEARTFYGDLLGLNMLMDHDWIQTWGNAESMTVQLSVATEGGQGTAVPDLSMEVDNLDEVLARMHEAGVRIEYGPAIEVWGVRRFYVRDPFGKLLNILQHLRDAPDCDQKR